MRIGLTVALGLGTVFLALARVSDLRAQPQQRLTGWRADLQVLSDSLLAKDRSFSPAAREEFRRELAQMETSLDHLDDEAILVKISRLVALAENAHTRLRLDPTTLGAFTTQFPIRLWSFTDGLYVIRTSPEYARALASRLVAINGHPIEQVGRGVATLFAGNTSWTDYLLPIYLESPSVLHGLGIISNHDEATFSFKDGSGKQFDLLVHSQPVNQNWENWQELSPMFIADGLPTSCALARERVPRYLRHPNLAYWFEYLAVQQSVYFQFNIADNAAEGPNFQDFADSLLTFVQSHDVNTMIVDLRLNSGGNLEVARDFMKGLYDALGTKQLFVITGHCTFSAGLYHAAQLKQFTHATFVGEPVGDRLDYWAEGGMLVLPYSGAVIEYADGFHRYSLKEYAENKPYYASLSVKDLTPDIRVSMTAKDYFSGRDAALEAIER